MRSLEFHPEADEEFKATARYFEDKAQHLGIDFINAVQSASRRILEFPESGRPHGRRLRRLLVPRFLYGVLYRIEPNRIFIVAIAHPSRRPGYWRSWL